MCDLKGRIQNVLGILQLQNGTNIYDVTCDIVHHGNINCSLPGSLHMRHSWSGHVILKLLPRYTGPVVSHRVVQ